MPINYYAIAKTLGAKMAPARGTKFGNFALLDVEAGVLRGLPRKELVVRLSLDDERVLVQAFESMRDGNGTDRLLWDKDFADGFRRAAREAGVHAPDEVLARRLIKIRKNIARYERLGIRIAPSTVREPHPSIDARYAHAVEFALVRLRYRYGASIDDILLNPRLGEEYVAIASQMAPALTDPELRLGALNLRKSRFFKKEEVTLFQNLDLGEIEPSFSSLGSFSEAKLDAVPKEEGLLLVDEGPRCLYVSKNSSLLESAEELVGGRAFGVMASQFWKPDPCRLFLRMLVGASFENVKVEKWQYKIIAQRSPVFNWPINAVA